jgi:hypothetical protein
MGRTDAPFREGVPTQPWDMHASMPSSSLRSRFFGGNLRIPRIDWVTNSHLEWILGSENLGEEKKNAAPPKKRSVRGRAGKNSDPIRIPASNHNISPRRPRITHPLPPLPSLPPSSSSFRPTFVPNHHVDQAIAVHDERIRHRRRRRNDVRQVPRLGPRESNRNRHARDTHRDRLLGANARIRGGEGTIEICRIGEEGRRGRRRREVFPPVSFFCFVLFIVSLSFLLFRPGEGGGACVYRLFAVGVGRH